MSYPFAYSRSGCYACRHKFCGLSLIITAGRDYVRFKCHKCKRSQRVWYNRRARKSMSNLERFVILGTFSYPCNL